MHFEDKINLQSKPKFINYLNLLYSSKNDYHKKIMILPIGIQLQTKCNASNGLSILFSPQMQRTRDILQSSRNVAGRVEKEVRFKIMFVDSVIECPTSEVVLFNSTALRLNDCICMYVCTCIFIYLQTKKSWMEEGIYFYNFINTSNFNTGIMESKLSVYRILILGGLMRLNL